MEPPKKAQLKKRTCFTKIVLVFYVLGLVSGCAGIKDAKDYIKRNYVFKINEVPASQLIPKSPKEH